MRKLLIIIGLLLIGGCVTLGMNTRDPTIKIKVENTGELDIPSDDMPACDLDCVRSIPFPIFR